MATETAPEAVAIAFQANVYGLRQPYPAMPRASGFIDTVQAITRGARAFGKPVLGVHGDNQHSRSRLSRTRRQGQFRIRSGSSCRATNGCAVRVLVDPDMAGVSRVHPADRAENGAF